VREKLLCLNDLIKCMCTDVGGCWVLLLFAASSLLLLSQSEMLEFTLHSCGCFGLWTPMVGGACNSHIPSPAVLEGFTSWNNEKATAALYQFVRETSYCVDFF
jgi:hypothetical protein